ncbi:GNAT family N-acetyltransferase [Streptomyces sp. NPDC003717]|uniref:GNAT family N-acetyltransferase n=1 Tax=Streptomyces sp. NPDC003717 TaxID=3154276 RepID=UPI0033B44B8F
MVPDGGPPRRAPDTGVHVLRGTELLPHLGALRSVYAAAFGAPPWNEGAAQADAFVARLRADAARPGFLAAVAFAEGEAAGFATAWTTPTPFPAGRCYPEVAAGLGQDRTTAWLCGARETDELAVRPDARGTGLAAALLAAVTEDAPDGRAWLLTSLRSPRAMAFYRRQGWTQATHPAPESRGIAVFLGPHHPARNEAARPL